MLSFCGCCLHFITTTASPTVSVFTDLLNLLLAADVILWRRRRVSCGIVIVATFSWVLIERSGISFLALCSDVLLILVVLLFLRANYAVARNKYDSLPLIYFTFQVFVFLVISYLIFWSSLHRQPKMLPELVLSEEMVNNAAASFRVKVNYMLLMAHDITLGKDFRLFFKVSDKWCMGLKVNSCAKKLSHPLDALLPTFDPLVVRMMLTITNSTSWVGMLKKHPTSIYPVNYQFTGMFGLYKNWQEMFVGGVRELILLF